MEPDSSMKATRTGDKYIIILKNMVDKISKTAIGLLKSGASPRKLTWSVAFAVTCGVFPLPGTTSLVCLVAYYLFNLHLVTIQFVNLLMTPINLATFISFIRMGEYIFSVEPTPLSLEPFKESPLNAILQFWGALCRGIAVWFMFVGPATCLLYLLLKPAIKAAMDVVSPQNRTPSSQSPKP